MIPWRWLVLSLAFFLGKKHRDMSCLNPEERGAGDSRSPEVLLLDFAANFVIWRSRLRVPEWESWKRESESPHQYIQRVCISPATAMKSSWQLSENGIGSAFPNAQAKCKVSLPKLIEQTRAPTSLDIIAFFEMIPRYPQGQQNERLTDDSVFGLHAEADRLANVGCERISKSRLSFEHGGVVNRIMEVTRVGISSFWTCLGFLKKIDHGFVEKNHRWPVQEVEPRSV